jgi:ribosomal protein S18 acetylase RimI-like enzyme
MGRFILKGLRQADFRLRPAKPRDYSFAITLYLEGAKRHLSKIGRWNGPRLRVRFRNGYKQSQTRILCDGDKVIGWIQVAEFADRLHLRQLHLVAPFRGAGIGTRLIEALLDRAAAQKKPVTLDVIHGNPAKSLYLRLGFKRYGQDADRIQMIWRPTPGSARRPQRSGEWTIQIAPQFATDLRLPPPQAGPAEAGPAEAGSAEAGAAETRAGEAGA